MKPTLTQWLLYSSTNFNLPIKRERNASQQNTFFIDSQRHKSPLLSAEVNRVLLEILEAVEISACDCGKYVTFDLRDACLHNFSFRSRTLEKQSFYWNEIVPNDSYRIKLIGIKSIQKNRIRGTIMVMHKIAEWVKFVEKANERYFQERKYQPSAAQSKGFACGRQSVRFSFVAYLLWLKSEKQVIF